MNGIVEYFGPNKSNHPCGYCKSNKPDNSSYGVWTHEMTPEQYQIMIDRGMRRSGKFCYKSVLDKICCPTFAIRCEALNFKPSRSQRKVIKRFNDFIYHGIKPKSYDKGKNFGKESQTEFIIFGDSQKRLKLAKVEPESSSSNDLADPVQSKPTKSPSTEATSDNEAVSSTLEPSEIKQCKDRTKKAKYLRLQRRIARISLKLNCSEEEALKVIKEKFQQRHQKSEKLFEDYFKKPENIDKPAHDLRIQFVSTCTEDHVKYLKVSHQLYEKYQTIIHKDDPSECTIKQFRRFLIDNPFEPKPFCTESKDSKSIPTSYGSYHMQYWLDDKLIAVAVLDILPYSVSSVYLFYDPEYSFLSLGTYSALREILLVRNLHEINPSISYYYLGLYIYNCPKMNYKGKFHPSFLLCDQALTWHPIEKCLEKLKHHTHPRFEDDPNKVDEDSATIQDDDILILYSRKILTYSFYKHLCGTEDSNEVYEYAKLVGKKCTKNFLLYRKNEID
ncbi:arginyl-tRNA--protein transferase 1 isoform X2 [Tetranychus urticae]|uniref:arginyl-tRNA--protein transferase 1 isoform X2 n=1 Tax=Tetranychus urticae TaxID=32264 RepID=UPI00077BBF04|nr:arginyl-tRNA--protein transferase 1 isoform X2 [Tetranychus urticae]